MRGRSVHRQGACMVGGMHGRGCVWQGGMYGRGGRHAWRGGGGACVAGEMATAADGMHPTGMFSCFAFFPPICSHAIHFQLKDYTR